MQTKHFVSDPQRMVELSLKSLEILQPELLVDVENKTVYASKSRDQQSRVSIVSGGGAGHEPSFTGFVGDGMLTAAVSGSIFASPSCRQVLKAIENVDSAKGILLTVMRYTGDILNFGLALEQARAQNTKLKIEMLVVGDDVAVTRSRVGKVGRRGIAGTVLIHKITGAMAVAGYELEDIVRVGQLAADNLVSIGVSLSQVHVPGQPVEVGKSLDSTGVELGMGIHNETGCGRRDGLDAELDAIATEMLRQLLDRNDLERNYLPTVPSSVILLVNNLGGLSVLEFGAITTVVVEQLQTDWSITVSRVYAGTFMTSLDGPGFSISLLNPVETGLSVGLIDLLDSETNVRGWQSLKRQTEFKKAEVGLATQRITGELPQADKLSCNMKSVTSCLKSGLRALIDAEPDVTRYDSIVGDGDCGITLKRGAEAINLKLKSDEPRNLLELLASIATAVESTMDGTSGALYAIFTNAMLRHVRESSSDERTVDVTFWTETLLAAMHSLSKYTAAQVGDRTMMDVLIPFVETLKNTGSFSKASREAKIGAQNTNSMRPGLGRTVYIGNEEVWLGKVPDPGAWGLYCFLDGLAQGEAVQ